MDSKRKFDHAKRWETIIRRFEKRKVSVRAFCKKEKIDYSTLYRNLKKLRDRGFDGLIDHRHGIPYKIIPMNEKYIIESRIKDKQKSGADIAIEIKKRFGIDVSRSQVCRKLKYLGLNAPVGRKPGKMILKKQDSI